MCGIAGVVWADPARPVDPALLDRMAAAIAHRGPDDRGSWIGPGVGLAHTRLSVIDLSPDGRQPMANEDDSVQVVYNGEIYNFAELRRELEGRGHRFRSRTDSEVIVHLYEELGPACVDRLDGMFALAVWDARDRTLFLARDRVGKKPLKYAEIDGGIVFASELKSILASGLVKAEVDPDAVGRYLSLGFVPSPGTGLRGIRKLPPAHRLTMRDGETRSERYWSLDFSKKEELEPRAWREKVRDAVERAVEKRLVSDVPLGAFLSGGIDSSIVVSCMSKAMSRPVETFSAGFDFEEYSELPFAKAVAERHGATHREFEVRAEAAEMLPRLARLYEEPFADCSALPSWLLAREARKHVTVVLTGDGGDEAFVGYPRYAKLADWNGRLDAAARLGAGRFGGMMGADALRHLADHRLAVRYGWMMRLFSDREKNELLGADAQAGAEEFVPWMEHPHAGSSPIDRMSFADTMVYLPDDLLVKVDLATMAHGLEARSPLLDPEVLETAASAPAEIRYRDGTLKALLKDAFSDALPHDLLERRKAGFVVPLDEWFRGELRPLAEELLLAGDASLRDSLDAEPVRRLVEEHLAGREARGRQLWALVMLELWQRELSESGTQRQPREQLGAPR